MKLEYPDIKAVVSGNTAFALDLYKHLMHVKGNLFLSPYGISVALAMTYAGARDNTESQIAQVLHFAGGQERLHATLAQLEMRLNRIQQEGHVQLGVANSLWPHKLYPFLKVYLALLREHYGVVITPVDYTLETETARKTINEWVEERTQNKITELIEPNILDSLTLLVLVNAVYFKGDWASKFQPNMTKDARFWLTGMDSIPVPMMHQTGKFRYGQADDVQILELPYAGNDLSMILLLPRGIDGLSKLDKALNPEHLEKWSSSLRETTVDVFLPRFKMSSEFDLKATLASMGMPDAFSSRANFAGMDGRPDRLYISFLLHKAVIEINEEGTEAAAASAVIMERGIPQPTVVFKADHPFVFLICDNVTRTILFLARVVEPVV